MRRSSRPSANMQLRTLHELDSSEGTVQLHSDTNQLILHPAPNPHDPNDPLRWPRWKKHTCFTAVCVFTFLVNYANAGLAPAFYVISQEFGKTQNETSALLLWSVFTLGLFNFFWVPVANYFGKRPVFVFALLLLSLCCIWGAVAKSFESLLWSQIVAAFAGSSTEALGAAMVNDLYFLHERGNLMGWYMNAIAGGNSIGPLICGFVTTGIGWRWHKWISFIFAIVNWIVVVLFVPETRYDRSEAAISAGAPASSLPASPPPEKHDARDATDSSPTMSDASDKEASIIGQLPRKTFIQDLSLFSGTPKNENILILFLRPLPLIAYPAVIFAFLGYAVSLAWSLSINFLNPFVLQAPPYNWSVEIDGLINIPGLIGNLFGAWAGGWLVDRYSDWQSRRHGGVFQPETRLHLLIIPTILTPAGCLMFGYGVQKTLHWTSM